MSPAPAMSLKAETGNGVETVMLLSESDEFER
jgi:hypothetical protein